MPLQISAFPAQPALIQTVTLGDQQLRLRLTWRQRMQAWYLDLEDLAGARLLSGARLSAGWGPGAGLMRGVPGWPGGILYVRGTDDMGRRALGSGMILEWFSDAELQAAAPAPTSDGVTVVLP